MSGGARGEPLEGGALTEHAGARQPIQPFCCNIRGPGVALPRRAGADATFRKHTAFGFGNDSNQTVSGESGMRFLLALVGIAALVVVALVSLGMLKIDGFAGQLPSVSVAGGKAPEVEAKMATVEFGTANKSVEVPTVGTTTKTIAVPTLRVNKPADATGNTVTTQ
jgi:hypothetical protein